MIRQDTDWSKRTKAPSRQMLRDFKDGLGHLRRDKESAQPSGVQSPEPMQIKADYVNMSSVQQNSSSSETRPASTGRAARKEYRLKALQEIRNSLLPFANNDNLTQEFSSASSTNSESSLPATTASGSSSGYGLNGVDVHRQSRLHPVSYCEENGNRASKKVTKGGVDQEKDQPVNGLPRAQAVLNLKGLRKSSIPQEGTPLWEKCVLEAASPSGISVTGLQHRILPDQPRLVNAGDLARQQPSSFPLADPPPPPPPPRGAPPPPTPPRGTTPPPPPLPPLVNNPGLKQSASRTPSSNYSSSSSQRGTSPVSIGRTSLTQLQSIGLYPNGQPTRDPPPPYPCHSPVSLSSTYSAPSYASSSSGRQSPTNTISSSEYSIPSVSNVPIQKRGPLSSYASPPPPPSLSNSPQPPAVTSTTVVTTILPRALPLQAWSARQAKSQSPVIMQSVKSTQVQKPVLQTAIAPTSPPPSTPQQPTLSQAVSSNQSNFSPQTSASYASSLQTTSLHTSTSVSSAAVIHNQGQFTTSVPNPSAFSGARVSPQEPPPYIASQVPCSNPSNPPPYPGVSSASAQPPPYTCTAPQSGTVSNQRQEVSTGFVSFPPSYAASVHNQNRQEISATITTPPLYTAPSQQSIPQDTVSQTPPVPTTEPPSYASSVAALAAQRASVSKQQPVVSSSINTPLIQTATSAIPATSDLVTTVESICSSQVSALQGTNSNLIRNNLNNNANDNFSMFATTCIQRKPSPIAMDTSSSASRSASRSESPVSHGMSQSPVSFMSLTSSTSPSTQSDSTHDSSGRSNYKMTHQSPIPPRKVWPKEKEEERRESKVRNYSSAAYKFFMEQHVENVLKSHQQREHRRQQLETEMAKVGLSEEAQCQMRRMLHQKESNYIRLRRAKMDKSMFTKIKTIGVGAFGEVALVKKVDTNQLYAMKTLRKADVLKRNQVAHVKAERDILAEADNEWVVKLYYSFQDQDNLYFVMDYIPGGDLMSLLIKFGIFQEPLARFYIAELVLAVESVHKLGFIHRDIKPDNILIDRDGHIKLTDFGLCTGFRWTHNSKYYQRNGEHARQDSMDPDENWNNECHCNNLVTPLKPLERRRKKEHQRCLAHSLVGTPNYIAPEVLMRTGYGQACDWWSIGVILYEMLVGQPPFLANTPSETQLKVINWETTLHIPKAANLSSEATDLTLKLCCGADQRLGKNCADEIKRHKFFESIDFEGGLRKQPAPYIPCIRYPGDTSNFDSIDPDKLRSSDSSGDEKSENKYETVKHPEHAFFEFTFRRFFDDGGQAYPMRISLDDNENQGSPVYV